MPTSDISYFHEKDLDKTNIADFYESLPGHLQGKFKASLHACIEWGNVLQGYRGPSNLCNNGSGDSEVLHSSHGLQEIKFWWGVRKDINAMVPVFGSLVFGIGRVAQSVAGYLDWSSLYFDSKTGQCLSHDKNEAADKLHERGLKLFEEAKYSDAAEYHDNAYRNCSTGYRNEEAFKNNANKAKSQLKAMVLNSEGDYLFRQGRYSEAAEKYKEAYDKSQVSAEYGTYDANRKKAQVELDAIDLSFQADGLAEQGKYSAAVDKYQDAHDKSQVENERIKYRDKKCQTVNKWLDTLWKDAWDAENDVGSDRSEEAKEIFETILRESKNNLRAFPDNSKLKQYESLATLKIEGNEMFNQGVESQQHGVTLFEEAQELKEQEKYELANVKFKEARNCFEEALEKFEIGSKSDRRFESCAEFVKDQINEVMQSITFTEQHMLGAGLDKLGVNVGDDNRSDEVPCEHDATVKSNNYYAHI